MTRELPEQTVISDEIVEWKGRPCICRKREIDRGRQGVTHVTVYEPCLTAEAREERRARVQGVIDDLIRRGLL